MINAEAFIEIEEYFPDYIIELDWDIKSPVFPQHKHTYGDTSHSQQEPSVKHTTSSKKVFKQISLFHTQSASLSEPTTQSEQQRVKDNIKNVVKEETFNVINQEIKNTVVNTMGDIIKEEVKTEINNEHNNTVNSIKQTIQNTLNEANSITNEQMEVLEQNIKIFHPETVVYKTELTQVVNNIHEKNEKLKEDIKKEIKKERDKIEKFLNT